MHGGVGRARARVGGGRKEGRREQVVKWKSG